MKKARIFIGMILVLVLLASCQPQQTVAPSETDALASSGADSVSLTPSLDSNGEPQVADSANTDSIDFYQPVGSSEDTPQYSLLIEPNETETNPPVMVECQGEQSNVYAPTSGIAMNNHCIIDTGETVVHVALPDGSLLSFSNGSIFQINLSNTLTQIILKQGEAYVRLVPQPEGKKFVVDTVDAKVEAEGTIFVVGLNETLLNVTVINGKVYALRCRDWDKLECLIWNEVGVDMESIKLYASSLGSSDWATSESGDPDGWWYDMNFGSEFARDNSSWDYLYDPASGFDQNSTQDDALFTAKMMVQLTIAVDNWDEDTFNSLANTLNQQSSYCSNFPSNCLAAVVTNADDTVQIQGPNMTTGGSPSGQFPSFDRSTCFTRDGHLWCYPVEGSVDAFYSGEWDLTEICNSYPGESFCAWLQ